MRRRTQELGRVLLVCITGLLFAGCPQPEEEDLVNYICTGTRNAGYNAAICQREGPQGPIDCAVPPADCIQDETLRAIICARESACRALPS